MMWYILTFLLGAITGVILTCIVSAKKKDNTTLEELEAWGGGRG